MTVLHGLGFAVDTTTLGVWFAVRALVVTWQSSSHRKTQLSTTSISLRVRSTLLGWPLAMPKGSDSGADGLGRA